ncbi:MAG: hypothetical protein Q9182_000296 [Xanthomendoza sp. 2 TL-2023]
MGFAVIFTRLSDGIGREAAIILAYLLFAAFSLGAGRAHTLNQLIALRVFQGIGGSGLYSMIMVVGVEVTPSKYWGALSGIIGMTLAIGSVLVFGLQQGGSTIYAWSSATIISTLTLAGACWTGFFMWTSWLSHGKIHGLRAIFPINIALARPLGPSIILILLSGCGLLSTLDGGRDFYSPTYGYEFILGLGVGLTFSSSTLLASLTSKPEDVAAAQGALSQARILGGSIGLAMATIVLNNRISDNLAGVVDPLGIKSIQQSVNAVVTLSPTNQALVRRAYSDAFNEQMRICAYLSAAGLLISLATYQKAPPSVAAMREKQKMRVEDHICQILMVHGFGTNAAIFEAQTAPLRALLPAHWDYHFVQAPLDCGPAPGIEHFYPDQTYKCWYHIPSLTEIASGHEYLYNIVEDEGPFDGAMMLASLLLHHTNSAPHSSPPFRSVILMNGYMPWSASPDLGLDVTPCVITHQEIPTTLVETEHLLKSIGQKDDPSHRTSGSPENGPYGSLYPPMLQQQHPSPAAISISQPPHPHQSSSTYTSRRFFPEIDKIRISIPTAHILGTQDALFESGAKMTEMCDAKVMRVYKHARGHEIPTRWGRNGVRDVEKIRDVIEKTVQRAEFG